MFFHSLLKQKNNNCAILLSLAVLTACVSNTPTGVVPPITKSVSVGTGIVDPLKVASLYDKFCYKHSPTFSGSIASLKADKNFKQQPETGTFFHRTLNLSVNATNRGGRATCSMIFKTTHPAKNSLNILVPFAIKAGSTKDVDISNKGGVVPHSNPAKNVNYDISVLGISRLWMKN